MPDETTTVGSNPNEPRPPRPESGTTTATALSVEDTVTGKTVRKRAAKITEDQKAGGEIESVTLEKDGRRFTIAKSVYDAEMAKPETADKVEPNQPIFLRHPDLVGAKVVS